ncbi:hypothetical protein [Neisseria sp. Ec49-e6-T10]|uniref:hypothetical protein n=1 Tax=Neisseria sp. Ec49-e6-T10 TaxID=3140744 RepID=UPI003EB824EB
MIVLSLTDLHVSGLAKGIHKMALYPAVVKSIDRDKRKVKFEMEGFTSGAHELPEAELMYAFGDRPENTEVEIIVGDLVWVDFLYGDQNYPILVGRRNKASENIIKLRKWHHENIELNADQEVTIKGTKLILDFTTIEVKGVSEFKDEATFVSQANMNGGIANTGEGSEGVEAKGGFNVKEGKLRHNGTDVGDTHKHYVNTVGANTGEPI